MIVIDFAVLNVLLLLSPSRDPALAHAVARAGGHSVEYCEHFRNYVAAEVDTQRRYRPSGEIQRERSVRSDYYLVALPSDPARTYEFRDVLSVDGKTVRPPSRESLLMKKGRDIGAEFDRLKRASNRYELFAGSNFLSNIAAGILAYVDPRLQPHIAYRLAPEEGGCMVLEFFELGESTYLREGKDPRSKPLRATGRFRLSPPDLRITRAEATVVLRRDDHDIELRYEVEYAEASNGRMLPARRQVYVTRLSPAEGRRLLAASEAKYSNFRRFATETKLTVEPM